MGSIENMSLKEDLHCVFTAEVESRRGSYRIEIPSNEIELGSISPGELFRVAILDAPERTEVTRDQGRPAPDGPPVEEGQIVEVEIDDIGEQGDGIARIGPGYIVFVPDTRIGDEVTIEITKVQENFGFGEVVDRT